MANKKTSPIVEEVKEEVTPVIEEPEVEPKHLIVTANLLNVRKTPSTTSEVLSVVAKNEKLLINNAKSNKGFYSVTTLNGVKGFVMKDFVVEE